GEEARDVRARVHRVHRDAITGFVVKRRVFDLELVVPGLFGGAAAVQSPARQNAGRNRLWTGGRSDARQLRLFFGARAAPEEALEPTEGAFALLGRDVARKFLSVLLEPREEVPLKNR